VFDGLVMVSKDGRSWQIGTIREVDWIVNRTTDGVSITSAIPPVFEAYAAFYEPDGVTIVAHEHRVQLGVDAKPPGGDSDADAETPTETNPKVPQCCRDT
jgi:hypothetical protein